MKKLILIIVLFPITVFSQQYIDVEVWQDGLYVGSFEMQSIYSDDYLEQNAYGYKVAMDKYLRYLEERESRERAERQRNALNQRLRKAGLSSIPSYSGSAAMEGYLSVVERSNSTEYNNLLEKYNNLLNSYNRLKTGYDKLLKERNSNRTSYNSSVNRQSSYSNTSKPSSNYIKSGIRFFHLKQPKAFGGDWGTYTSGLTDIVFVDDKLYSEYYRKVKIKGNVGYINMNSFK